MMANSRKKRMFTYPIISLSLMQPRVRLSSPYCLSSQRTNIYPSGTVTGLKDAQTAMALQEAEQVSGEDFSGDWGERHEDELTDGQAQQTSGEDFSGDWGERHDGELGAEGQAQQTSGEPDAAQEQPVQYTDLPLDAEGYPVE